MLLTFACCCDCFQDVHLFTLACYTQSARLSVPGLYSHTHSISFNNMYSNYIFWQFDKATCLNCQTLDQSKPCLVGDEAGWQSHSVCSSSQGASSSPTVLPLGFRSNSRMNLGNELMNEWCRHIHFCQLFESSNPFWQSLMSEQQFETFYQVGCTKHFPQHIFQLAFHFPPTGLGFVSAKHLLNC